MKENQKLYHFIPFSELVDICESPGQLILKSPRLWDDNYEGYFYRKLMDEKSMPEMFEKTNALIKDSDLDIDGFLKINITTTKQKSILTMLLFSAFYYLIFYISWSKKKESDALWRIYNYNNRSLRISTKLSNFEKIKFLHFHEVEYKTHSCLKKMLDDILVRNHNDDKISLKLFMPFCIKRKAFHHENEVRMFYFHDEFPTVPILNLIETEKHNAEDLNSIIKGIDTCFDKNDCFITSNYKKILDIYLSPFKGENTTCINLNKYNLTSKDIVDDVMVHPLAPDYYVEIVEKYCKRFDLKFLDKSKLYKFL